MSESAGVDRSLLAAHRFLRRGPVSDEGWSQLVAKTRDWERSYVAIAAVAGHVIGLCIPSR